MKNLVKQQYGAQGFKFFVSENKGNTRLGEAKQTAIIKAVEDSWTEGVYQTTTGNIKRQLLNGNAEFLTKDSETGEYYFS